MAQVAIANHYPKSARSRKLFRAATANLLNETYISLAKVLNIDSSLEIGARCAETSVILVKLLDVPTLAFEANPETFRQLTVAARGAGVKVYNKAVTDIDGGTIQLYVPDGHDSTSGSSSTLRKVNDNPSQVIEVSTTTIDSILSSDLRGKQNIALWMDVEGATSTVMNGGNASFLEHRFSVLKVEFETAVVWNGGANCFEVDDALRHYGMTPVAMDAEYISQFNVLYVRNDLLQRSSDAVSAHWRKLAQLKLPFHTRGLCSIASLLRRFSLRD